MTIWIVGRVVGPRGRWEFQGAFSTEPLAVAACRDSSHFVGPAELNKQLPHNPVDWEGAYYPHAGQVFKFRDDEGKEVTLPTGAVVSMTGFEVDLPVDRSAFRRLTRSQRITIEVADGRSYCVFPELVMVCEASGSQRSHG